MQLETAFQNPQLCHSLLDRLNRALEGRTMRFMEVCGTHTVAIFQSGLRSLLPKSVTHLSGPGCPVCVTHDAEVAAFLELAGRDRVIIATFGDLLTKPLVKGGLDLGTLNASLISLTLMVLMIIISQRKHTRELPSIENKS